MILVFAPQITPRISYIFEWFLGEIVGIDFKLTHQREEFGRHEGPKFTYASQALGDELHFGSYELLFESGIRLMEPEVFVHEGLPTIFKVSGVLPFDPFAAAFYLVTRYEEYLPFEPDQHGRFSAKASIALRHGFLQMPVIEKWGDVVRQLLIQRFPGLNFRQRQYTFTPTYDVDVAWAYKHRSIGRTAGAYLKSLYMGDFNDVWQRTAVLLGRHDPYFTFDYLDDINDRYRLNPVWFFHVGRYGKLDKNIRPSHPQMRKLIERIASGAEIGVHPSYRSNRHPESVVHERKQLEAIVHHPITKSRQHYLVMSMPETYRRLIDVGITDDYSMGYSTHLGFRAGTSLPFWFYDLAKEEKTNLRVHPFAVMDTAMQYSEAQVTSAQVPALVEPIIREVKSVQGKLMTIFHNNSFSEAKEWIGWRKAYEQIIEMAVAG